MGSNLHIKEREMNKLLFKVIENWYKHLTKNKTGVTKKIKYFSFTLQFSIFYRFSKDACVNQQLVFIFTIHVKYTVKTLE